jgi:hypothetical protein
MGTGYNLDGYENAPHGWLGIDKIYQSNPPEKAMLQ